MDAPNPNLPEPTPAEVKTLREHHRLTRWEFGQLVYQTERAVTAWEQGTRAMPLALWELMIYKLDGTLPPRAEYHNPKQFYLDL